MQCTACDEHVHAGEAIERWKADLSVEDTRQSGEAGTELDAAADQIQEQDDQQGQYTFDTSDGQQGVHHMAPLVQIWHKYCLQYVLSTFRAWSIALDIPLMPSPEYSACRLNDVNLLGQWQRSVPNTHFNAETIYESLLR